MTAPQQRSPELVVASYLALMEQVRQGLASFLNFQWLSLLNFRDASADRFVESVVPVVGGAQQQVASLTDQYLSQLYGVLADEVPDTGGVELPSELRGVPAEELYRRPFETIWYELSRGKPLDDAVDSGKKRLDNIATTDVTLAARYVAREKLAEQSRVVGYRRVLTGAENCGLCVVASTQRYHKADLLPIHPGCDCVVAPIVGDRDPGRSVNSAMLRDGAVSETDDDGNQVYRSNDVLDVGDLLEPVHQAIEKTFGKSDRGGREIDYRKVMTTHEHGELGPVLAVKGQHFTGPSDLK